MNVSESPLTINFADVDKIKIQKPKRLLLPCNQQINLFMTSAPSAKEDLNIYIEGIYRRLSWTLMSSYSTANYI